VASVYVDSKAFRLYGKGWRGVALGMTTVISINDDIELNSKKKALIEKIFRRPPPSDVDYDEVESLLVALGAVVIKKGGSHFFAELNGQRFNVIKPHAKGAHPKMDKGFVKELCEFLLDQGIVKKYEGGADEPHGV